MRLIDADRLLEPGYTDMFDAPIRFAMVSRIAIERAPTVYAIPIEFIKEQIAKTTDINDEDELDFFYAGHLGYLLNLWEEQNEKDI